MKYYFAIIALLGVLSGGCHADNQTTNTTTWTNMTNLPADAETITLGAGCFWCTEAVFQQIPGVLSVTSGYMGGTVKNPSYDDVCTGNTGHAEVSRVIFDPKKTSLEKILAEFWEAHDPTSLNRQ